MRHISMYANEQILDEARRLFFEERDYRATHDLLHRYTTEMIPDSAMLLLQSTSLGHLDYQEMLDVLRKYPDELEVRKGVAENWVHTHWWEAVDVCTGLLETEALTPQEELDIRWARIRAGARAAGNYRSLVEDFRALWSFGDMKSGRVIPPYRRSRLVGVIAQLTSVKFVPALQSLSMEPNLPESITRFFQQKAAELIALDAARQELDKRPENEGV
jgi:hypothetical protein